MTVKKYKDTSVGGSVLADGAQRGVTNNGRLRLPNVAGSFKADRKNNLIFLASLSLLRVHHLERGCR